MAQGKLRIVDKDPSVKLARQRMGVLQLALAAGVARRPRPARARGSAPRLDQPGSCSERAGWWWRA